MLSERLETIADLIEYGETMADIGTDHGFLPVYLIKSGKCTNAIATDISKNSLKKAEELIISEGLINECSARVGNGLAPIDIGEVDDAVIAGMGGILMAEILSADIGKSHSFKKIILQPRSKIYYLRKWIRDNGFSITKERIAKEGERFCEILLVEPCENSNIQVENNLEAYSEDEFLLTDFFPETLIYEPNELTLEYLQYHLIKNEAILTKLKNNMSKNTEGVINTVNDAKLRHFESIVRHLKMLIKKYEETKFSDAY